MSSEINFNPFILRITEILQHSPLLFPKTIGKATDKDDLVKQVIAYKLAIPQDVVNGEGPPHIFVDIAANPVVSEVQSGRDTKDAKGPRTVEFQLWAVCVVNEAEFALSQQSLHNITHAVTETLGRNQTLLNLASEQPLAISAKYTTTPFTDLKTDEKNVMGRTVVITLKAMVNLRE